MLNRVMKMSKNKLVVKSNKHAFVDAFDERCYQDVLRLSKEAYSSDISWSTLNLFFSRKLRLSKEMTRLLVQHLSRRYPITYNKFCIKVNRSE